MSYLQRFTAFLASVPEGDKGLGMEELLRFAQTPVPAAAFEPKWEDVQKLVAGERGKYIEAREKALTTITALRLRVTDHYEAQTGRPITAAAPSGVKQLFQHPVDKQTYTVLQNLQNIETNLVTFTL